MMQHFRKTEVLQQRHDVSERFVKRKHVRIGRIEISWQDGVEQRMRRLMRDGVVREAGENDSAGKLHTGGIGRRRKIAKNQRFSGGTVKCLRRPERVWVNPKTRHEGF